MNIFFYEILKNILADLDSFGSYLSLFHNFTTFTAIICCNNHLCSTGFFQDLCCFQTYSSSNFLKNLIFGKIFLFALYIICNTVKSTNKKAFHYHLLYK